MEDNSVNCIVTSPPYWGLRDYGVDGQLGLEKTPEEHVAKMVKVFAEVKRVLRDDGTAWVNYGDCYAGGGPHHGDANLGKSGTNKGSRGAIDRFPPNLKPKDLVGIPWRVAFGLQADGWYLRSDIIWQKPNAMPESVTDRPTKSHEYVFLLSQQPRYYYDADAVKEPAASTSIARRKRQDLRQKKGWAEAYHGNPPQGLAADKGSKLRNLRDVWTISTKPYRDAHFATFPEALVEPCVKAGCPEGGTVLDPFGGAGTTCLVSERLGRHSVMIELSREYAEIAKKRLLG